MRAIAVDLLQAFIPMARGHPGIHRWACRLATHTRLGDSDCRSIKTSRYCSLSWRRRIENFSGLFKRREPEELAGVWVESNPHSVATKICRIEQEGGP